MFRYLKPPPQKKKKNYGQFNIYLTTLITVGMICFIFDFSFFIIYFQIEILKVERGLPHLITENESVNTATGKYQLINLLGYDMNFGQIQDFILFFFIPDILFLYMYMFGQLGLLCKCNCPCHTIAWQLAFIV